MVRDAEGEFLSVRVWRSQQSSRVGQSLELVPDRASVATNVASGGFRTEDPQHGIPWPSG